MSREVHFCDESLKFKQEAIDSVIKNSKRRVIIHGKAFENIKLACEK